MIKIPQIFTCLFDWTFPEFLSIFDEKTSSKTVIWIHCKALFPCWTVNFMQSSSWIVVSGFYSLLHCSMNFQYLRIVFDVCFHSWKPVCFWQLNNQFQLFQFLVFPSYSGKFSSNSNSILAILANPRLAQPKRSNRITNELRKFVILIGIWLARKQMVIDLN